MTGAHLGGTAAIASPNDHRGRSAWQQQHTSRRLAPLPQHPLPQRGQSLTHVWPNHWSQIAT